MPEDWRVLRVKCGVCDHEQLGSFDAAQATRTPEGLCLLACPACGRKAAFPVTRAYALTEYDRRWLRKMRIDPEAA